VEKKKQWGGPVRPLQFTGGHFQPAQAGAPGPFGLVRVTSGKRFVFVKVGLPPGGTPPNGAAVVCRGVFEFVAGPGGWGKLFPKGAVTDWCFAFTKFGGGRPKNSSGFSPPRKLGDPPVGKGGRVFGGAGALAICYGNVGVLFPLNWIIHPPGGGPPFR